MIIVVGSTNQAKVQAVKESLMDFQSFSNAEVVFLSTDSEVSDQPLSLKETIQGAKNRSRNAFNSCKAQYGFGIEGGIMEASDTRTGFLQISVCSIFDGARYAIGFSSGFEIPSSILELIFEKKMNLAEACLHSGISSNTKLGSMEGLIGILTKGKIDRKEYCKQGVLTAILQLENANWYTSCEKSPNT